MLNERRLCSHRLVGVWFVCLLLLPFSMLPLVVYAQTENNLFVDNFEGYQVGSFPSAGGWEIVWDGMGQSHQVISTSYSFSPTRSFQLWGRTGWSAVVQRRFSTNSPIIGYELSILIDERGSEYQDHPAFFCRDCETWGAYYGAVLFDHSNGTTFRVEILSFDPPTSASPGQTVSVPLTVSYEFSNLSYVSVAISRRLANGSYELYELVWYNPDYNTPRSGQGTLSYTASFQVPSQPGTHSYIIRASYWDGQRWIKTDEKYFSIVVQQPTQLAVDVWTNKGGQGRGNTNGGQYNIGESITLYCSVNINVDSLRIRVIRPDGVEVIALERGSSSAGTYTASGTVGEPVGERRVICEARSGGQSSSDEVRFNVVSPSDTTPPTVRVIAPNGGETLFPGNVFRIRWEASDNVGVERVHIWLFQGNTQVMVVASNLPNTGYYDWTVPNRPGGNYRIRIAAVDAAGNAAHDDSDGTFEIVGQQPQAEVIASNLRLSVGEEGSSRIILSRAPAGLSGYDIIVRVRFDVQQDIAEIVDVRFPDWAGLQEKSISNHLARLRAVDIRDGVRAGSEGVVLAEVVLRGKAEGTARIEIEVVRMDDDTGGSIPVTIRNGVLEVIVAGPPPVESGLPPPRDLDGDGLYEDINGNGRLDFDDVVKFFQHFDEPVISQYTRYYDFNRNGRLDFGDIVELFRRVGG